MSLYQCQQCGCLENTACGRYHSRNMDIWEEENRGKALCSACAPSTYISGEPARDFGKWHGRFKRRFLPKGMYETNRDGNLCRKDTKKYHEEDERDEEYQ